jgi:phosphoribosylglycinamide formyltransferase-1
MNETTTTAPASDPSDVLFRSPRKRGRVMVMLSGRGSNFLAIHDAMQAGTIDAEVALVFSNKDDAPGLAAARSRGLETMFLNPKLYPEKPEYDKEIIREAGKRQIDLIVLAGYMKIITPGFCDAFPHRIVNIHPALLPSFPGLHVQQRAIDWGVRWSGCTTHFVSAEVDAGAIILQACVPVLQEDNEDALAARILVEEHKIYPETVRLYFQGRLEVRGRRVFISPPLP